jgi:hypothetical protein
MYVRVCTCAYVQVHKDFQRFLLIHLLTKGRNIQVHVNMCVYVRDVCACMYVRVCASTQRFSALFIDSFAHTRAQYTSACEYVRVCACICVYVHVNKDFQRFLLIHLLTQGRKYTSACEYTILICMYENVCIYSYIYICVCVCVFTLTHTTIYTYPDGGAASEVVLQQQR